MRRLLIIFLIVLFLIIVLAYCQSRRAQQGTTEFQTVPIETPFATVAPVAIITPTTQPPAPAAEVGPPAENSEWYIDGWTEDVIVASIYGREIRFDLAELRNTQTNAAIVVQCIDPDGKRPNLDFTLPVEQRDRFVYRANQFWHTVDPTIQRFIFIRHGELQ